MKAFSKVKTVRGMMKQLEHGSMYANSVEGSGEWKVYKNQSPWGTMYNEREVKKAMRRYG